MCVCVCVLINERQPWKLREWRKNNSGPPGKDLVPHGMWCHPNKRLVRWLWDWIFSDDDVEFRRSRQLGLLFRIMKVAGCVFFLCRLIRLWRWLRMRSKGMPRPREETMIVKDTMSSTSARISLRDVSAFLLLLSVCLLNWMLNIL